MEPAALLALLLACAPQVHTETAQALIRVESAANPWAIGVVGGRLDRQPRHQAEALATANALQAAGWNFSVGLGQINVGNFERLGLNLASAFEPCTNLQAMQTVLVECFDRATERSQRSDQAAAARRPVLLLQRQLQHRLPPRLRPQGRGRVPAGPSTDPREGDAMNRLPSASAASPLLAALLAQAAPAWAQGFDKINTTVTNVNTILVTISVAVVTIAIIWAGFKMIFQGARLADVANVLIGGTLVGGAAAFASYIVT